MGCDLNIFGNQPDPAIRTDCLCFVRDWMGLVWHDVPDDEDRRFEAMYPLSTDTQVRRLARAANFRVHDSLLQRYRAADRPVPYEPGVLAGVVMPWRDDPFVFDTKVGGELCTPSVEIVDESGVCLEAGCTWPNSYKSLAHGGRLVLLMGYSTRIPAGNAHHYVLGEILRTCFILNCRIHADYDVELYSIIFSEMNLQKYITKAAKPELPSLAVDWADEARVIYKENARQWRRSEEERPKEAKAKIFAEMDPCQKAVYLGSKDLWHWAKQIPLLGLTNTTLNPLSRRVLKLELEEMGIGVEQIGDTDLNQRIVSALESAGVHCVRDAMLLAESDVLSINGLEQEDVRCYSASRTCVNDAQNGFELERMD